MSLDNIFKTLKKHYIVRKESRSEKTTKKAECCWVGVVKMEYEFLQKVSGGP